LQGNQLPPSYYLMKQIMEVRDISTMEWHSCEAGCTGWEPIPKSEWHKHKDDKCPKCNGKRFKQVLSNDTPVRVRWRKVHLCPACAFNKVFALVVVMHACHSACSLVNLI
jgi:hypothetical protein